MRVISSLLPALGPIFGVASTIYTEVEQAMADGTISADEAARIGQHIGYTVGSKTAVKVNGKDILHGQAAADICSGLARIIRQVILAERA